MSSSAEPAGSLHHPYRLLLGALAFVAGVYPYALPLFALLKGLPLTTSIRKSSIRSGAVLPWILAVSSLVVVSAWHRTLDPNLGSLILAALTALVFKAYWNASPKSIVEPVGTGFLIAFASIVAICIAQVLILGAPRANGPSWFFHPNVLAHYLVVFGLGVCSRFVSGFYSRLGILIIAGSGVISTGSRSGILALAVIMLMSLASRHWRRPVIVTMTILAVALAGSLFAFPDQAWAQRLIGPLAEFVRPQQSVNLLNASGDLDNALAWNQTGVVVTADSARSTSPRSWGVKRTIESRSARPQQSLRIEPGTAYVVSIELIPTPGLEPGILGWGSTSTGNQEFVIRVRREGSVGVSATNGFKEVAAKTVPLEGGWIRLEATFQLTGPEPMNLSLGPSPDLASSKPDATVLVRAFQVELGSSATDYEPSRFRTGTGEAVARLGLWEVAMKGIAERPLLGNGPGAFPERLSSEREVGGNVERHPHNQFLASTFEGGFVGLVALMALTFALCSRTSFMARATLIGLLAAQFFDSTIYALVVLLPATVAAALPVAEADQG